MCLYVTSVPANRQTRLICSGLKWLERSLVGLSQWEYVTPYQSALVPRHGWLFPDRPSRKMEFYKGQELGSGFIHFYDKGFSCFSVLTELYTCYGFGVEAFECPTPNWPQSSAIARCLYIKLPHHDDSTEQTILSLMDGQIAKRGVTPDRLIKALPRLEKIREYLC